MRWSCAAAWSVSRRTPQLDPALGSSGCPVRLDRFAQPRPSSAGRRKVLVVLAGRPGSAPGPPDVAERCGDHIARNDDTSGRLCGPCAVDMSVSAASGRIDECVSHIGVLDRVDIDRSSVSMLRQAPAARHLAAVEARRVVGGHRRCIVTAVRIHEPHPLNRPARLVQASEDAYDGPCQVLVDDHLAFARQVVPADVEHPQVAQVSQRHGTPIPVGVTHPLAHGRRDVADARRVGRKAPSLGRRHIGGGWPLLSSCRRRSGLRCCLVRTRRVVSRRAGREGQTEPDDEHCGEAMGTAALATCE